MMSRIGILIFIYRCHKRIEVTYDAPVRIYWEGQVEGQAFGNLCVYTERNDIEVQAIHTGNTAL
jgi:hypothetical protein